MKEVCTMKAALKLAAVAIGLAVVTAGCATTTARTAKDPTKYDCYVYIRKPPITPAYEVKFGPKIVKVCPYKDKMAAGKCETDMWGRMRCIE